MDEKNGFDRRGNRSPAELGVALAGGGILLGITAIILDHRATVHFRRAANRYNRIQQSATSLRLGPDTRGLGMNVVYTF